MGGRAGPEPGLSQLWRERPRGSTGRVCPGLCFCQLSYLSHQNIPRAVKAEVFRTGAGLAKAMRKKVGGQPVGTKIVPLQWVWPSSKSAQRADRPNGFQVYSFCCHLILHQPPAPLALSHWSTAFQTRSVSSQRILRKGYVSSNTASGYIVTKNVFSCKPRTFFNHISAILALLFLPAPPHSQGVNHSSSLQFCKFIFRRICTVLDTGADVSNVSYFTLTAAV